MIFKVPFHPNHSMILYVHMHFSTLNLLLARTKSLVFNHLKYKINRAILCLKCLETDLLENNFELCITEKWNSTGKNNSVSKQKHAFAVSVWAPEQFKNQTVVLKHNILLSLNQIWLPCLDRAPSLKIWLTFIHYNISHTKTCSELNPSCHLPANINFTDQRSQMKRKCSQMTHLWHQRRWWMATCKSIRQHITTTPGTR